jgi:hypothetical protein
MAISNATSGRVVTTLPIRAGVDANALRVSGQHPIWAGTRGDDGGQAAAAAADSPGFVHLARFRAVKAVAR